MDETVERRLETLGIALPPAASPVANYRPYIVAGDHLFVSGQLAKAADGTLLAGRLGAGLSVAEGQAAARLCALNVIAQAKVALGRLDRVRQVLRVTGFVAAVPEFTDHPLVLNGASDLLADVFGDKGRHTRAAVGAASLPAGSAVEVDAIFWIEAQ